MSNEIFNTVFDVHGEDINSIESVSILLSPANGKTQGVVKRLPEIEYVDHSERISVSIVIERHKH